jgi:hypothetical protein
MSVCCIVSDYAYGRYENNKSWVFSTRWEDEILLQNLNNENYL